MHTKKSCREKLEEAINSWRASSSVFVSKPFPFFFFTDPFFYFPFTFIAYFGRVRINANDPAMCKPTHLIDADAINKSTRIPPLTFFVPFHPRYSAFLRLLTKVSSELLPP
jgi:hypothetical protein